MRRQERLGLKMLPTYKTLNERKVWGMDSSKCPRCKNSSDEILQEMRASLKINDNDEINVRLVEMKDDLIEWIKVSKVKGDKDIIDRGIELEKSRGITKELKRKRRKKVIESEGDESSGDEGKNQIKKK
ncbi:hypothetical protein C1646_774671 [Rhizophagus diaphanus]|nr:hypothetical protein C1646_774671 [Rhizophagus diaphanus] [Rhizophagus sp. MUCL 43196]